MHVMTKYLDTRKAAIAALQDYAVMEQIIESTDEQIKAAYADAASPASPRIDGTPPSGDLHASENRIVATIERIDTYKARYAEARQYMDWFLPAWEIISEDDRLVLEAFFLGDGTQDDAVQQICNHFYVEPPPTRRSPVPWLVLRPRSMMMTGGGEYPECLPIDERARLLHLGKMCRQRIELCGRPT
ncbi:Uncharacterised protein [Arcanobacterium haemolyticum]|uniref:hypothetical protein n=1 Tax=Arcanobacterium haemolyticum TaxID=28264 RepID=UPI000D90D3A7|nr:Uncharacterised protein [Arcanobacterium haemolyticum]